MIEEINKEEKEIKHEAIINIKGLHKDFVVGNNILHAIKKIDLTIYASSFVVIYGPSGCGKSTLLNIISGIDKPTKGEVIVRGTDIFNLSEDNRGEFRSKKMGIVYQLPIWIKSLNVMENVALPLIIEGKRTEFATKRAREVMEEIGISDFEKQMPTQLSGGQQQKAGLARALVSNPWILLCDEPTGNLDSTSSDEIMAIFDLLNRRHKRTIVMVTHNQAYWTLGNRRIEMKDGIIIEDIENKKYG